MPTLLMLLAGPMQSWGTSSRFDERETGLEPSKSGVLGLVCAALGRDRRADITDLAGLRMGVRVDREGTLRYDYQTAQDVALAKANPRQEGEDRPRSDLENAQSRRYFLSDAVFLVGLEGPLQLLEIIDEALANPKWPLFLGRKSYLSTRPVRLGGGVSDLRLEAALAARQPEAPKAEGEPIRYVIEAPAGARRCDQPVAPFASRSFGDRFVQTVECQRGEVPRVSV